MKSLRWTLPCLLLALAAAPAGLLAQDAARDLPKKEISETTSEGFAELRTLTEAKNYDAALALLERLLAGAKPESFDVYVLSQIKAQVLLSQNKLLDAIAPVELALRLGENNPNFYDQPAYLEQLNLLAQLYYQRAAESKDPAAQKAGYERALATILRWFERAPRPTAETRLFAASLLYQLGTLETGQPDAARLRESMQQAREGLLLSAKPGSQLYLILVAAHIQLGEHAAAAELLELLAARDPRSSSTWSQLQSLYLATAAETKDADEVRRLNLRALHVLDRAQAAGQLDTPKDHYTRVAILFNIQQFGRAAELLEKGLADGSIENSKRNWELLASAYQQIHREERALDAMDRATKQFPDDAALEFSLAQTLHNTGDTAAAYTRGQAAVAKAGLEKPGQARIYLAYLAYELQRYEEAQKWVAAARESGGVPPSSLDPLASAISDALALREAAAARM